METPKFTSQWEFLEAFYPDFINDPESKRNELLQLIFLTKAEALSGDALNVLNTEFDGDKERVETALLISDNKLFSTAIENYLTQYEPNLGGIWEFVEKYLNGYYQDDNVAQSNDLSVIIEHKGDIDPESCAVWELENTCEGDWTKAETELLKVDAVIFGEAIDGYNEGFCNHDHGINGTGKDSQDNTL